jgi:hypothetical protein
VLLIYYPAIDVIEFYGNAEQAADVLDVFAATEQPLSPSLSVWLVPEKKAPAFWAGVRWGGVTRREGFKRCRHPAKRRPSASQ